MVCPLVDSQEKKFVSFLEPSFNGDSFRLSHETLIATQLADCTWVSYSWPQLLGVCYAKYQRCAHSLRTTAIWITTDAPCYTHTETAEPDGSIYEHDRLTLIYKAIVMARQSGFKFPIVCRFTWGTIAFAPWTAFQEALASPRGYSQIDHLSWFAALAWVTASGEQSHRWFRKCERALLFYYVGEWL